MRELRVGRSSRRRYDLDHRHLGDDGELLVDQIAAARRLAGRLNERGGGAPTAHAGEIVALGLLHEVAHALVDRYERDVRPGAFASALDRLDERIGHQAVDDVLDRLAAEFGRDPDRPDALESLVLLDLAAWPSARHRRLQARTPNPSASASIATGCRSSSSSPRAPTSGWTSCRAATAARSGHWTRSPTRNSTPWPGAGSAACG